VRALAKAPHGDPKTMDADLKKALKKKRSDLFEATDIFRENLAKHGIVIKDHANGSSWSFEKNSASESNESP